VSELPEVPPFQQDAVGRAEQMRVGADLDRKRRRESPRLQEMRERTEREPGPERKRREAIEDTFTPWHQQPVRIARLLRWLILMGERPANTADFIEHAETWQEQYDEMRMFEAEQ
jgi:hypothetical protein